jgi:hypothetical protein
LSGSFATRPGTSVKIKSVSWSLVRRSRRASTRSSRSVISGRLAIHEACASRSIVARQTVVMAVAVTVRGPGSNIDNTPNMSDGPMMVSSFSRPSTDRRPIFTFPVIAM